MKSFCSGVRLLLVLGLAVLLAGCVGLSRRSLPEPLVGADTVTLFGVAMQQPFGGMSECKALLGEYNRARSRGSRCFERAAALMGTGKPLGTETLRVLLAGQEEAHLGFVFGGELQVELIHGVVHSVTALTRGGHVGVFDYMQSAFGKPASLVEGQKETQASWALNAGVQLTFTGPLRQGEPGVITLHSPVWQALAKHPPLARSTLKSI